MKEGMDVLGTENEINYLYLMAVCYKGRQEYQKSEKIYNDFKKR